MQEHTAALDTKAAVLQVICPILSYEEASYTISAVPSEAFLALLRWRGFCACCPFEMMKEWKSLDILMRDARSVKSSSTAQYNTRLNPPLLHNVM